MKMLRIAGLLAVVALGLSASHTKGTVGEGQLPPPGAPSRVRCGSAKCEQKYSVDGHGSAVFKVCAELSSGIFSHLSSSLLCSFLSAPRHYRAGVLLPSVPALWRFWFTPS